MARSISTEVAPGWLAVARARERATSTEKLSRASQVMRGDWDADGVTSVHLPRDVAYGLLRARGWTRNEGISAWVSPSGKRYWHTDEALQLALVAETC